MTDWAKKQAPHLKPEKPCFNCKKRDHCVVYHYPDCHAVCYPLNDWKRAMRKRGVFTG